MNKRKAIESLYNGVCTITVYREIKNEKNKTTKHEEVDVIVNHPCRLSYMTVKVADENDVAAKVTQVIKLFISPDIVIKPGSKITVTQNGVTADYQSSGEPARYPDHQEIVLELFKGWA